jgi:pimeloyl-ACP methyl ester carboxylesterase
VVFVMGLATPLEGWNEIQYLLHEALDGADYQSLVFDNAGSGLSHAPAFYRHSIHSMCEDAWDLVDSLAWQHVHFVSVSMGGMIAMEMALARPARYALRIFYQSHI